MNIISKLLKTGEKNKAGIEQLKRHEGLRLKPYKCTAKKITIGYGRNLDNVGISEGEATDLLHADIERAKEGMKKRCPYFDKLNAARQWVLINMAFNLGVNNKKTLKNTLIAIEAVFINGDNWETVALIMGSGKWASQVKGRAKELIEQMETGEFKE